MLKNSTQTINTNVNGLFPTQIHKFFYCVKKLLELSLLMSCRDTEKKIC